MSLLLWEQFQIVNGGTRALGHTRHRGCLCNIALALTQAHNPIGQDTSTLTAHGQNGDFDRFKGPHVQNP